MNSMQLAYPLLPSVIRGLLNGVWIFLVAALICTYGRNLPNDPASPPIFVY